MLWLAVPVLHEAEPFRTRGRPEALGLIGATIAFAVQMSMGASWRVGVAAEEVGAPVTGGLCRISRNPAFPGQAMLLAGVALAIPSLPTLLAAVLVPATAPAQIRDEERVLRAAHGADYDR